MFPCRFLILLVRQNFKSIDQNISCFRRNNHLIDQSKFFGFIGVGHLIFIFINHLFFELSFVFSLRQLMFIHNFYSACRSHYCNFGCWPGKIKIATCIFTAHHNIGTAIGFSGDNCNFRDCSFAKGIKQFSSVSDDTIVLLLDTR
ncbi:hypothetical protein SDC9_186585 [bioreactor metagenome]|uniref:Uncharacterized protein n=1 Tax=bioreactor metagenome TaxID=1076179 RepID=A0A645HLE8_9ZZZZ